MPRAVFEDIIIAEFDDTILLEGNHYFPPESVNMKYLHPSKTQSAPNWIGKALYYDLVVGKKRIQDAAWSYPEPSKAAMAIKDHVAFQGDVTIIP